MEPTAVPAAEPAAIGDEYAIMPIAWSAASVQRMIDALPEEVTWENYEDVKNQCDEIFTALNDLLSSSYQDYIAVVQDKYKSTNDKLENMGPFSVSGGTGTAEAPYLIKTKGDLKAFRSYVNAGRGGGQCYELVNTIDLGNEAWTPIGKKSSCAFSGTFDGGNHTISGISGIEYADGYAGLFGYNSGTVKNLTVEGSISASGVDLGGIVGENHGIIEGCTSAASVSGGSDDVGGIAGRNIDGTIQNCTNTGDVSGSDCTGGIAGYSNGVVIKCSNTGSVSGPREIAYTGGIVGWNYNTVRSCSNTGSVSGGERTGGIVGWNFNAVNNCWNTGSVNSNAYAGGIVGWNEGYCTVKGCWNKGDAIGPEERGGIIGAISAYGWSGENSYSLDTAQGAGGPGEKKAAEQFASGEVAWLLQNGQEDGAQVWGQQLPGENYPVLTEDTSKRVYKVTFQTDETPTYAVRYVNTGKTVALPEDPKKDGYTFYGWSTAPGAEGEEFDASTVVTRDMTVYAVDWEAFTGDSGDIPCPAVHGTGETLDLSKHVHYGSDASTAGKFNYTITAGNDALHASIDGDVLTVPAEADAGEYTLSVTAKDKQADNPLMQGKDALSATLTFKVTVAPAELELTVPEIPSLTYGDALTDDMLTGCTAAVKDTDVTVEGAWAWAVQGVVPTVSDSGVTLYKVVFAPSPDKAENFTEASLATEITVTVEKAPASGAAAGKTGLVYTDAAQELVEVTEPAVGGAFRFSGEQDGEYGPAVPTGTDAGDYTFWYKVAGDENHADTEPQQLTVTIGKVPASGAVAGKTGLVYTGAAQELVEVTEPAVGGAFRFSGERDGEYGPAVPTGTGADAYTVWYKVEGDKNHTDTEPQMVEATIEKAVPVCAVTMADYTCMETGVEPEPASSVAGADVSITYAERGAEAYSPERPLEAGSYTVKAVFRWDDVNYEQVTATADFKVIHHFNAGWEQREDGYYHLCACGAGLLLEADTLTQVPEGLRGVPQVDTVEKIQRVFEEQMAADEGHVIYDVKLEVLIDGAWVEVTPENFPAEGVVVTLPYPGGTDAGYDFSVVHMFTASYGGHAPGDTETLRTANTAEGIQFTVKSLSPICVGWRAPAAAPAATAPAAPDTGDSAQPLVWAMTMCLSAAALALLLLRQGRRRSR